MAKKSSLSTNWILGRDEYFVELIFNSEAVGGISSCSTFHLVILATPKLLLTKQGRIYSLHNDDLDMLLTSKLTIFIENLEPLLLFLSQQFGH